MSSIVTNHFNSAEIESIRKIATSDEDRPVLMLNLIRYRVEAGFPEGELYKEYRRVGTQFIPKVGGRVLWSIPVYGQPVGEQPLHEMVGVWYPSHKAFLSLRETVGAEEFFNLRGRTIEYAVIHRCPADVIPMPA